MPGAASERPCCNAARVSAAHRRSKSNLGRNGPRTATARHSKTSRSLFMLQYSTFSLTRCRATLLVSAPRMASRLDGRHATANSRQRRRHEGNDLARHGPPHRAGRAGFRRAAPDRPDRPPPPRPGARPHSACCRSIRSAPWCAPTTCRCSRGSAPTRWRCSTTPPSGRKRTLFEYWAHEASFLPLETWPLMRWRMERARQRRGHL